MFEQGEQIICIDGKVHPEIGFLYTGGFVKEGEAYIVRDCELGRGNWNTKTKGWESATWKVLVAEIHNPIDPSTLKGTPSELGFNASRFRTVEQLAQEERSSVAKQEPVYSPVGIGFQKSAILTLGSRKSSPQRKEMGKARRFSGVC